MNTPKPKLRELATTALKQKAELLAKENNQGGYSPTPHSLYKDVLPKLREKYDKDSGRKGRSDARDAVFLLGYLHAWTNGKSENEFYMWAFPTVEQIRDDTGIHGDRINPLCKILEDEGLLVTRLLPWHGNVKKFYLPLYNRVELRRKETVPPAPVQNELNGDMTAEEINEWL